MVWAGISADQKTALHVVRGRLNAIYSTPRYDIASSRFTIHGTESSSTLPAR